MADPAAVSQTVADAAKPAELVQAGRSASPDQLNGSGGVFTDEALQGNQRGGL